MSLGGNDKIRSPPRLGFPSVLPHSFLSPSPALSPLLPGSLPIQKIRMTPVSDLTARKSKHDQNILYGARGVQFKKKKNG